MATSKIQQEVARALTDTALAERLDSMAARPATWSPAERAACMAEAADRLRFGGKAARDAYARQGGAE